MAASRAHNPLVRFDSCDRNNLVVIRLVSTQCKSGGLIVSTGSSPVSTTLFLIKLWSGEIGKRAGM